MIRAIKNLINAIRHLFTGQIDSATQALNTNPHVIRATYEAITREKTAQIKQYRQAVAGLIAQEENKITKLKTLTQETANLEKLKTGALAKAKQTTTQLQNQGQTTQQIHQHPDYKKCLAAYNDFTSTLTEKQARIDELETDIQTAQKNINDHKIQLQQLLRDVEKIKTESADTIADIISAKQEKEIADTLAGITQDNTAQELQNLRQTRQQIRAETRITKELTGTDTKTQENEFLQYAQQTQTTNEFDTLLGLTPSEPQPQQTNKPTPTQKTKTPPQKTQPNPNLPE